MELLEFIKLLAERQSLADEQSNREAIIKVAEQVQKNQETIESIRNSVNESMTAINWFLNGVCIFCIVLIICMIYLAKKQRKLEIAISKLNTKTDIKSVSP